MIWLVQAKVVVVSFTLPYMEPEEFFADNVIQNIAMILNVPLEKVRIVEVIRASESRKKRTMGITIGVEIGDLPATSKCCHETTYPGDLFNPCPAEPGYTLPLQTV